MTTNAPDDAGWPAPPRALTARGVAIAIAIAVFAVAMAVASIYMRRTQVEQTTRFFGSETIFALRYGRELQIVLPASSPMVETTSAANGRSAEGPLRTNLTASPGLGHFRHALLDDGHYQWATEREGSLYQLEIKDPEFVTVEISGPPKEVVPVRIEMELSEGWIGRQDGTRVVRVHERVRKALRNFINTRKDVSEDRSR